jgi:polyhydroxybutyrate depolymerase
LHRDGLVRSLGLVVTLAACSATPSTQTEGGPDAGPSGPDAAPATDANPTSAACSGLADQPRDATWTVGGRSVKVHVPASYDPTQRTPVVINLHGYASDGGDQARVSKMIALSDAKGFIAVHAEGHHSPRGWNAGVCCGSAASSGTNDTMWISAVIDELEATVCVDGDRVFATGLSNGAFMAYRLACELSDRIAAVAPVAGVVGITTCNPTRPVAVFHVHGTSDNVIPYTGGGFNGNEPVATTINRWTTANGCSGAPATTFDHGDATCVTRSGCTGGADVTLCTIDGGGHQWPGGESIGLFNGKKSDDLDSSAAMWTFFVGHPRG